MRETRDFDAMLAEKTGIRPTFKVGGQEFTLRSKLPYGKFLKLVAAMSTEGNDAEANMAATQEFFRTVLIRADRSRFDDLLTKSYFTSDEEDDEDDEDVIDFAQIPAVTGWVLEHFTGKERMSTDGSSPGATETGPQPNVVSLSSKKAANA